ncbi:hypothetical protein [Alkaliphilus transvaalensis]|uniref:hypothetical protein n=1 Tax=Alkaliphilus transvaalensis TaxID=114628 RepID=UPI00047DC230|nr:hypothetical protein [Alkaliphilus transvaalensis]
MRKICIVILVLLLSVGCTPQSNEGTIHEEGFSYIKTIENELKDEYDGDYNIPIHPEYEILRVHLINALSFLTFPPDMVIYYGVNKGDLIETFEDPDFIKSHEEGVGKNLYGLYEGAIIAQLTYSPVKGGEMDGDHFWSINGYNDIPYVFISPEQNKIYTKIDLEQGGYNIIFHLSDYFTEDDAKAFTTFLLNKVKPLS